MILRYKFKEYNLTSVGDCKIGKGQEIE